MSLADAQAFMRSRAIDGWLVYDFHGSNPTLARVLPGERHLTRRVFWYLPAKGEPRALVGAVDRGQFAEAKLDLRVYTHRDSLVAGLKELLAGARTVAMEYAPGGVLPYASRVDGGTLDLVRGLGAAVVSSGDLYQHAFGRLDPAEEASHRKAAALLDEAKDRAFAFAFDAVKRGSKVTEHDVQQEIVRFFDAAGMVTDHPPIVAVNANASDPHYAPTPARHAPIRAGDWLLIDLWAKLAPARSGAERTVFADITWVGSVGSPTARQKEVFALVRDARDAGVALLAERAKSRERVTGAEVDAAVRGVIARAGLAEYFTHRTGHSVGVDVHSDTANIDGFETIDTRELVPGSLFTIEPGVYLPEFGVRSEIDVLLRADGSPEVTTRAQRDIVTPP